MTSNESTDNTTKITDVIAGPNYLQASPQPLCGATTSTVVDIEQTPVEDDPRQWPNLRKYFSLFLITMTSMIAGFSGNIENPAVEEMERELGATSDQFSLSLSMFILTQGLTPLAWCAISEVKGRKLVYLISLALFTIASIVIAISKHIVLIIASRAVQAAGSSAVIAIGTATLTDIFEPQERGTKLGIYYISPFLGPAIGPILGGALTTGFGWRSIFWFLSIVSGTSWFSFLCFFHETFRKGRSLTYQDALKQCLKGFGEITGSKVTASNPPAPIAVHLPRVDLEEAKAIPPLMIPTADVNLRLKDVNPLKPIWAVLRRVNNLAIFFASGFMFALIFLISYISARTLSIFYNLDPLMIGVVAIAVGSGCVTGSLLGGCWSDYKLAQLKEANGGNSCPEMRLKSTIPGMCLLPPFILGLGWASHGRVHVALTSALLFGSGFSTVWTYSSALAYLVDANNGRPATAIAVGSMFRGIFAFIAIEIAIPIQVGIGSGWLYTIWSILMALSGIMIIIVLLKGEGWRKCVEQHEAHQNNGN